MTSAKFWGFYTSPLCLHFTQPISTVRPQTTPLSADVINGWPLTLLGLTAECKCPFLPPGQIRVHIPRVRAPGGVPLPAQLPADPRRLRVAPLGVQGQDQHGQHALRRNRHQLLLRSGESVENLPVPREIPALWNRESIHFGFFDGMSFHESTRDFIDDSLYLLMIREV